VVGFSLPHLHANDPSPDKHTHCVCG
jgi:hypothetical protein